MRLMLRSRPCRLRCAYCHDQAQLGLDAKRCRRCSTIVHPDCWHGVGCPTHGCQRPVKIRLHRRPRPLMQQLTDPFVLILISPLVLAGLWVLPWIVVLAVFLGVAALLEGLS